MRLAKEGKGIRDAIRNIIAAALDGAAVNTVFHVSDNLRDIGEGVTSATYMMRRRLEDGAKLDLLRHFDEDFQRFLFQMVRRQDCEYSHCATLQSRLMMAYKILEGAEKRQLVNMTPDEGEPDMSWVTTKVLTEEAKAIARAISDLPPTRGALSKIKAVLNRPFPITNERTPEKLCWLN